MKQINIYDALELMRRLSQENVPFSISFISCNRSLGKSNGLVKVKKVLLTKGYRDDQSEYAKSLISYENADTGEHKQFWFPLLLTLNDLKITHERIRK